MPTTEFPIAALVESPDDSPAGIPIALPEGNQVLESAAPRSSLFDKFKDKAKEKGQEATQATAKFAKNMAKKIAISVLSPEEAIIQQMFKGNLPALQEEVKKLQKYPGQLQVSDFRIFHSAIYEHSMIRKGLLINRNHLNCIKFLIEQGVPTLPIKEVVFDYNNEGILYVLAHGGGTWSLFRHPLKTPMGVVALLLMGGIRTPEDSNKFFDKYFPYHSFIKECAALMEIVQIPNNTPSNEYNRYKDHEPTYFTINLQTLDVHSTTYTSCVKSLEENALKRKRMLGIVKGASIQQSVAPEPTFSGFTPAFTSVASSSPSASVPVLSSFSLTSATNAASELVPDILGTSVAQSGSTSESTYLAGAPGGPMV